MVLKEGLGVKKSVFVKLLTDTAENMALTKMDLEVLNNNINMEVPSKSLSTLEIDAAYEIKHIMLQKTLYGEAINVELVDANNKRFRVYLPRRTLEHITEDVIKKMNNSLTTIYGLVYRGDKVVPGSTKPKFIFEFVIME